jgi:hypothetical protein
MPTHRSKEEWDRVLSDFKESGLSRAKFCLERGVKESTLEYHLSKRRKSKFVELKPAVVANPNQSVTVELPGGAVFRLEW